MSAPETDPIQALSLAQLPDLAFIEIATFLDHESLCNLGATCSPSRRQLAPHEGALWKALHDDRWKCGERLRFPGLPSQWPRDGARVIDEALNWREEFIRRFQLEGSVYMRVTRFELRTDPDISLLALGFKQDGSDIWDELKRLSRDQELSTKAMRAMVLINRAEAEVDLLAMTTIHAENATFEDAIMIIAKHYQENQRTRMSERKSSDDIYNLINREQEGLTQEDVRRFGIDALAKRFEIIESYSHRCSFVTYLVWRVSGDPLWETARIQWRRIMQDFSIVGFGTYGAMLELLEVVQRMVEWINLQSGHGPIVV